MRDELTQRVMGVFGYGGAGVLAGATVADVEIWIRVVVGVLTIVSLSVHTYIAISKHRSKGK